jgi:hypothetical protein
MTRDDEIRTILTVARLESLTAVVLASDLAVPDVRRLAVIVLALLDDDAVAVGRMPALDALDDEAFPAAVRVEARRVIAARVLDYPHDGGLRQ